MKKQFEGSVFSKAFDEVASVAVTKGVSPAKIASVRGYFETKGFDTALSAHNNNTKTGAFVLTINFPAVVTCNADAPCKGLCYAKKGNMAFANVQQAYYRNYILWLTDSAKYWSQLQNKIDEGFEMVRVFDSGDIPEMRYLVELCEFIKRNPNVAFSGFTKQYDLVNEYITKFGALPENYKLRFSLWNKEWDSKIANPYKLPVAVVILPDGSNTEVKNVFHCTCKETCSKCKVCYKSDASVSFDLH